MRLFRARRGVDAVVTGSERSSFLFALLQRAFRRRAVPHIIIVCMWNLSEARWRRAVKLLEFRAILPGVSRVVVWSRRQVALYRRAFPFAADKLVAIPFHTTLYGAPVEVRTGDYVFAGGDSNRDYATLVEAAKHLPRRVVIAAFERGHFRGLDVPPNVEIVTADEDRFFALMAQCGIVMVPVRGGLLHSGGHQTYLNAMALGKAVVIADDCGADEYVTSGIDGIVVPPGDAQAIREALRCLAENRHLAEMLSHNARITAARYSPEKFFEAVLELVRECVGAQERRPTCREIAR